jgi:hypothetical protein
MFRNTASFKGEELLAPHPTLKLDDHLSSAVRDYLLTAFHIWRAFLCPQTEDAPCYADSS